MMIRQPVLLCAAAYVSTGCAQLIGIEDLPELMGESTPDASIPAADAGIRELIPCMPAEGTYFCYSPDGYPAFEYEGDYQEQTPCKDLFEVFETHDVSYGNQTITLKYLYHGDCGSYARIENAPTSCAAILERTTDHGVSWAWVGEVVEPYLDFAYTQIGNNLDDRRSRAVLICDGEVLQRTDWY
jgi:hypothetical protein